MLFLSSTEELLQEATTALPPVGGRAMVSHGRSPEGDTRSQRLYSLQLTLTSGISGVFTASPPAPAPSPSSGWNYRPACANNGSTEQTWACPHCLHHPLPPGGQIATTQQTPGGADGQIGAENPHIKVGQQLCQRSPCAPELSRQCPLQLVSTYGPIWKLDHSPAMGTSTQDFLPTSVTALWQRHSHRVKRNC